MKFCTNNKTCNLNIECDDKSIEEVETTKFLGLQIKNNLCEISGSQCSEYED
jgi:hypothetical protein